MREQAGRNQAGGAGGTARDRGRNLKKWAWTTPVEKFGTDPDGGAWG